nr:MAG TPA: hypothetical protein [Caudoviricetes sp.]
MGNPQPNILTIKISINSLFYCISEFNCLSLYH